MLECPNDHCTDPGCGLAGCLYLVETDPAKKFTLGQLVRVVGGDYTYTGWIDSIFKKRKGLIRYVVEDSNGRLFIHNDTQLHHPKKDEDDDRGDICD